MGKDQRLNAIISESNNKIKRLQLRLEVRKELYKFFKKEFNKFPWNQSDFKIGCMEVLDGFIDDLDSKNFEAIVSNSWIAIIKNGVSYKLFISGTDTLVINIGINNMTHVVSIKLPGSIYNKLLKIN